MKTKIILPLLLLLPVLAFAQKDFKTTAYKMYTCENKHLDIKNLSYKDCPFKARNYSISINGSTILIVDNKNKFDSEYTDLTKYSNVNGFEHYVDDNAEHLSEFFINKEKKLLISHGIIDNGQREVYEVYLLK